MAQQHEDQHDDDRHRDDVKDIAAAERHKALRQAGDGLAVGQQQRGAQDDVLHAQAGDKRGDLEIVNDDAGQAADEGADDQHDEHRQPHVDPGPHQQRGAAARERAHVAGGQVDLAAQDDVGRAQRHQRVDTDLAHHVGEVGVGEEVIRRQRQDDEEQQHHQPYAHGVGEFIQLLAE